MKKNFRKSLRISLGVTAALAGVTFIPVASQVNVYADTGEQMTSGSITPARLKELEAEVERAQAKYDAAVADEKASRAEVVNAERARDDALERYEQALEKYPKGYAGFLQWVIENTNTDEWEGELQVAEAQQVLADLDMPEYQAFTGEQISGLFSFTGDAIEGMGTASSSTNLTRMYHALDWMEAVSDYISSEHAVDIRTSHSAMMTVMEVTDFLASQQEVLRGGKSGVLDVNNSQDWMNSWLSGIYGGAGFKLTYVNDKPGSVSDDGVPEIAYDSIITPAELFDFRIRGYQGYNPDSEEYSYNDEVNVFPETAVMGFALGSSETGDYIQWAIADEYEGNFFSSYSLSEYIAKFREYFSISDPASTKLAYIDADDDLSNANKKLAGAQELVTARLGRLRETEKEYEEAVALFNQQQAQAPAIEDIPVIEENVSQENESTGTDIEYVPAEEVAVEENVVNELTELVEVQPANTETETTFTETEGSQAEVETPLTESVEMQNELTESVEQPGVVVAYNEPVEIEESVSSEDIPVIEGNISQENESIESVEVQAANTESETTFTESVSPQAETITPLPESFEVQNELAESVEQYNDSGNLQQEQLEVAAAYNESVEIKDSAPSYEVKQTEDNIYEVTEETPAQAAWMKALSYFFNGGAIAFIIPAGIKRRRKPDGTPFTVS